MNYDLPGINTGVSNFLEACEGFIGNGSIVITVTPSGHPVCIVSNELGALEAWKILHNASAGRDELQQVVVHSLQALNAQRRLECPQPAEATTHEDMQ